MHTQTIAELSSALRAREISSEELTRHYLDRIQRDDSQYNSYITVCETQAMQAAKQADQRLLKAEQVTPMTGIPIAHKDIFCTAGIRTSAGSKMLDNFVPPYESTVTQRLQQSGAVCLGKLNMDEFAMGSSNETSFYGAVNNPWNTDCVPGGSSGGSAAAVAAMLAAAATGTDTGGSIRQPASFCGITGLKPTYGRVSRHGIIAYASSLDQAGPMAKDARDCAILLNAMAGFDPLDSTSSEHATDDFTAGLENSVAGLRIGVPKEFFGKDLSNKTKTLIEAALKVYESLGAQLIEISLPHTELAIPTYYVLASAEASTNLSRYDGVRYGHRCENPVNLKDLYTRTREEGFGAEVKRRILVGTYALSAGYYDAYYRKAQQTRRLIKQDFVSAFEQVDVIASPTTPSTAFQHGSKSKDPTAMYLEDIYTLSLNLAGLPGMSIPAGTVDNMPVGLQLIGQYFAESQLLNTAHQFQQATDWHQQRPVVAKKEAS